VHTASRRLFVDFVVTSVRRDEPFMNAAIESRTNRRRPMNCPALGRGHFTTLRFALA
jgi:hypothetical protein